MVLLDIRMPRGDGVSALQALRAERAEAPAAVMLSAFRADAIVLDALRAGAVDFLARHTSPGQIVDAAAGQPTVSPASSANSSSTSEPTA
jgi:DNA-binding NarL/FixJ family response regulator